ncbi:hypothetical protein [Mesorhizobium sp. KR9-304]|uniref:hypothetical protein n=1 Tax=Mesorhizobium sp. KR9-304 TaxID=3156614 RepID=UPI0032B3400A
MVLTIAFLQIAGGAFALPADDYATCLVGQAVIALHNQSNDAINPFSAAIEAAHAACSPPDGLSTKARSEISDYVETIVEDVAGGLNLLRSTEADQ